MPSSGATNPGMRSFYWLKSPGSYRAYGGTGEGRTFTEMLSFAWAKAVPSEPVAVHWGEGSKTPSDVIWTGVSRLVVSARFQETLAMFTGWSTYPVEVYDGWGNLTPGYAGLAISGRCGRMLHDLSRVDETGRVPEYIGVYFSPETWDGTDIFYSNGTSRAVITSALRAAMRKANLTNYRAIPLPDVRTPKDMVDRMRADRVGPYSDEAPPGLY